MVEQCASQGGRRRRHTKKHGRSRRRHTRRGGAAFASAGHPVLGQGGQPAGLEFSAVGVSGSSATTGASNYGGAPSTATGYSGGRRRSRRGRKSRRSRHRMRGGGGTGAGGDVGSRIMTSFGGESVGGTAPGAAVRGPVYAGSQGT